MDTITVRFTTHWPPNPTSPIIAALGGSRTWSHVMNIIDGIAYEATMLHGCRNVPVEIAMKGVAYYQDMYVPVPNIEGAIEFGKKTEDAGYDFGGAFGIPFLMSDDWSDWSKWWCSERSFKQIWEAGTLMLDSNVLRRITPEMERACNYPKSEVIYAKST